MTRGDVSEDYEKGVIKGEVLTVEELRVRYSSALIINNEDIIDMLFKADHPLNTTDIRKGVSPEAKTTAINAIMLRLFKDKLVIRFRLSKGRFGYLLSEKGWNVRKDMKTDQ